MGVIHAHSWLMASFPQAAQEETYGADPDTIISAVIAPRGEAKPVEGGYVLNGFWPFASGCQHAQFLLLGARIFDQSGTVVDEADRSFRRRRLPLKTTGTSRAAWHRQL